MRKTILLALGLALLCGGAAAARAQTPAAGGAPALARSRQLLLVTTPGWDDVRGTLRRFERRGARGRWSQVGAEFPVVVGRSGLGWGVGLFDAGGSAGPFKREGDGRAPAGVFRLGPAFGFDGSDEAGWVRLPYRPLALATECVDDAASRYYNRIVERGRAGAVDWNSSERMRSVEGYRWGLVVAHNAAPPVAGRGSCIFLHIWAGPGKGTAGCTAMERGNLEALLRWLDARSGPLLVQLPEAEYARLRSAWRLPQTAR
ncbi:MAG TPA: L,D-transpeptidase family protein [Pyrinomonadaceae bacterium]